jgi:hypothetical protein
LPNFYYVVAAEALSRTTTNGLRNGLLFVFCKSFGLLAGCGKISK